MRCLYYFIIVLGILLSLATPSPGTGQIAWNPAYEQAISLSQQNSKPVFVYFYTEQAAPCIKFTNETLSNQEVIKVLSAGFNCVKINAQTNPNLSTKYGVYKTPTILILKTSGEEISRFVTFFTPDQLIKAIGGIDFNQKINIQPIENASTANAMPGAIIYEPFESIYGWENNGSQANTTAQITLVAGIKGNAFKIEYNLDPQSYSYIQIHRGIKQGESLRLPDTFTLIVNLAGKGGANSFQLKLADKDGTNFGVSKKIPTDFTNRRYVFTSDEIKYLWGGTNKTLDDLSNILIGISSDDNTKNGALYIDELVIFPGIVK